MSYSNSAHFQGDPQRVLAAAATILTTNGFTVTHQVGPRIEFAGPGLNSTRQNPLLGASQVTISAAHGRLTVEAEYGGVDALRRFMIRFPLRLGIGLGSAFALTMLLVLAAIHFFGGKLAQAARLPWWLPLLGMLPALLAVSPWLVLAPWIRKHLEAKTTAALDSLMTNACQMTPAV